MNKNYHFLASANTGIGFKNNFLQISTNLDTEFKYILKGGPGTGKSTLMRRVAEYFNQKGEDIEYFYCSSDANSLDGLRIVSQNIIIIDGTAPHLTEIGLPQVNGKIINLGDCIDGSIIANKQLLIQKNNEKSELYKSLYQYLKLASLSIKTTLEISENIEINKKNIVNKLMLEDFDKTGSVRSLFIDYWGKTKKENLLKYNQFEKKYIVKGNLFENNEILNYTINHIIQKGYNVIKIKNILIPELTTGIFIPQANTLIIGKIIKNKKNFFHYETARKYENLACKILTKIKTVHKDIERVYKEYINYAELDNITAKVISDIEHRIEEKSND